MSPETFNAWRIAPRLMVVLYGFVCWRTFEWFTDLADPTMPQSSFAMAIWGAAAAWFGFYVNSGNGKRVSMHVQPPVQPGYEDHRSPYYPPAREPYE